MSFLGFFIIFLLWGFISLFYDPLVFPGPFETFNALFSLFTEKNFWLNYLSTITKTFTGLGISLIIGIPLGLISGLHKKADKLIRPFVMVIQGAPVISYIVIAMMWFGLGFYTPVFVSVLVILPAIIFNISTGISNTDSKLIEMAKIYRVDEKKIYKYIYFPSILPFIISTIKIISGSLWRSVVVGEFLSGSKGLGYGISLAKTTLNTEYVFAYTVFLIITGTIFEKTILKITYSPKFKFKDSNSETNVSAEKNNAFLDVKNLSKKFDKVIIKNINFNIKKGQSVSLIGESGCGKTTILKILSGIIKDYTGTVENTFKRISYIFQDDRLIPWLNVSDNIKFVNPYLSENAIKNVLDTFGIKDSYDKYPFELSGGMLKRACIARAVLYNPDLIIMDEALASVDLKNKNKIISTLRTMHKENNFAIINVSHNPAEIAKISETLIFIEGSPATVSEIKTFQSLDLRNEKTEEKILSEILNSF
ncbi:MAG: ATP-binding cassette domain-containing protein [Thermotogae bacterium]|nr:ATP-binding cassette domain-containing protein [Thermotogota bacterium]